MTITLELDQDQLRRLVELTYLGEWLANAHRTEPLEEYSEIENLILQKAAQSGLSDLVDEAPEPVPSQKLEEGTPRTLIDDFEENTLWEKLLDLLTENELYRRYTEEKITTMTQEDRFTLFFKVQDEIQEYLLENGTDHLTHLK